jgi:Tol biopolymer transport system component
MPRCSNVLLLIACTALPALAASPKGLIAFASNRGGQWDIWVMQADGSNPVNLTNDKAEDDFPAFSPDGKRIVWTKGGHGPSGELWVMNVDGSGKKQLTFDAYSDLYPSWSPDGRQIAWRSLRKSNGDIYVMNADGTDVRRLTSDPADDFAPAWSPDGGSIAFTSLRRRDAAVWVMNPDGSDQLQLTRNGMHAGIPSWSPDGTKILFVDGLCDRCAEGDLFIMNSDGSKITPFTDTEANERAKSWSADGKLVLGEVARAAAVDRSLSRGDLAVWDVATGAMTKLTDTNGIEEGHADWSPEGRLPPVTQWVSPSRPVGGGTDTTARIRPDGGVATIEYTLPRSGHVRVRVFDVAGREVARPVDEWQHAGSHITMFPFGASTKEQVFHYKVECGGRTKTGQISVAP